MKIIYDTNQKFDGYSAFDFHIHSKYSFDCTQEPKNIIRAALKKGLCGLAVTDHNTIRGAQETKKICEKVSLGVIIGCEIETDCCDVVGLFLEEEIDPKLKTFDEVIEAFRAQDAFVILPHPFKYRKKLPMEYFAKVDAIEVFNGRMTPSKNLESKLFYFRAGTKLNLCAVGSSDAHFPFEVGQVQTLLPDEMAGFEDAKTLRRSLSDERVIVRGTESPKVSHVVTVGIDFVKRWMMGIGR